MTDISLYTKISSLPESLKTEVADFIDFLRTKKKKEKSQPRKGRKFGYAKGSIIIKPGVDDPIEEFNEYM